MKFRVVVTPEAQEGIREAFRYIHERAPLNAARWLRALYRRVDSLEKFPERFALAREAKYFGGDLRQLVFQSHRVVFQLDRPGKTVWVLWVRHAKRRPMGETGQAE